MQKRLRSPQVLSIRATDGQNFASFTHGAGKAPCSREYGRSHTAAVTALAVCGARFSGLSSASTRPSSTSRISWRMAIIASQKRSSSAFDSLSVGSTISVPATGHDIVGAWKP